MSEQFCLFQSLIPAIANSPDLLSALDLLLYRICKVTHWDYGEAWLPMPDSRLLTCSQAWYGDPSHLHSFRSLRETLSFPPNSGLPGRVWTSQQPEWIEYTVETDPDSVNPLPHTTDQPQEFQAGCAIPILLDDRVIAVLTFFTRHSYPNRDQQWMEWIAAIAMQLGLVMERRQLTEQLHQQQEFNQNLVETHGGFFVTLDPQGKTQMMNPKLLETLGYTLDEVKGTEFVTTFVRDVDRKSFAQLITTPSENSDLKSPTVHETGVLTKDSRELWVEWRSQKVFKKTGELDFFFAIGRDQNQHCLTHKETARLASFPLLTPNPIVEIDLTGRVRYLNPEAMRVLPELLETEADAEHPFLAEIPSMIRLMQQQGSFTREVKIGEIIYEQVLHYVSEIECIRIYAFDITDRKRAEEQLLFNAFYDRLTGLANRALFMDRLRQAERRAQPSSEKNLDAPSYQFAVVLVNFNRFKVVNDSLGNQLGDQLLQEFGQRLQNGLRPTDTVARLGGDEFAILLEGIHGVEDAVQVAEAIEQHLMLPFNLKGRDVFMTASIGIALNTNRDRQILSAQEILRNANTAMHRARSQGQPSYVIFDQQMLTRTVDRLQLETDMRRAIERQEFQVHYQPIVSLLTHQITGFEALVRWQHPQRGLIFPAEFISIAEETGLIIPIGWWILREACHQLSIWQQQFQSPQPLTMNVNLSCKQFTQPDLLEQIDQILEETNISVGSLKLEITESVVIDNPELVKELLLELKKRQIHLCIDDFGTGYSSLSRLHHFPISTLKIDRSFISRIGALGENSEIVQAIITLARTMSMDVVAEGIELLEQVSPLVALQCHYGQGFLFSKPLDSDGAKELLCGKLFQLEPLLSGSMSMKSEVKASVALEENRV